MFFYGADPRYYLYLVLPILALTLLVELILKATYAKYSHVESQLGISGAEAARRILQLGGIRDVEVAEVSGFLSDHYDPTHKVLRLSPKNFEGRSIAAIGIAAHEAGHALQHAQKYAPLVIRNLAVPVANIGSGLGYLAILIGVATHMTGLAVLGLLLLCGLLVFQIVNLPVEFDASRRALAILPASGILTVDETRGARRVLGAAAMTYVAAMIATLWQILYWAMRLGLIGGRRSN